MVYPAQSIYEVPHLPLLYQVVTQWSGVASNRGFKCSFSGQGMTSRCVPGEGRKGTSFSEMRSAQLSFILCSARRLLVDIE